MQSNAPARISKRRANVRGNKTMHVTHVENMKPTLNVGVEWKCRVCRCYESCDLVVETIINIHTHHEAALQWPNKSAHLRLSFWDAVGSHAYPSYTLITLATNASK